jgi:transcriptional regulator with XRE-family HTH domain
MIDGVTKDRIFGDMRVLTNDEARTNIAANVRWKMQQSGISQANLAKASKTPLMTVNNIINGQHQPLVAALARIAEALGVSLDWLVAEHSFVADDKNLKISA